MINSIEGVLRGVIKAGASQSGQKAGTSFVYIDCNGLEFEIFMSAQSIDRLPDIGEKTRVLIYEQRTETNLSLYGFNDLSERETFLNLLKVNGLGPKSAIKIMSRSPTDTIKSLIDSEDIKGLEIAAGVTSSMAKKLILTLKGHLHLEGDTIGSSSGEYQAALDAAVAMGYDRGVVCEKLETLLSAIKLDDDFLKLDKIKQEEVVFKQLLARLV